ncbi:MAG: PAS domain S-box protein, partial [Acidobacteria bacterium]|nr:PAS domain S-box protein [Acidobacteriota bacterium]
MLAPTRTRRRVRDDERSAMLAILEAQQDATLDGILIVDNSGKILTYNRRFLEIWNIPESIAASGNDNDLLGYASTLVDDWDSFIDLVNYLYEHPDEVRNGDAVQLRDGRELARSSVPVRGEDGKPTGRAWYFRDVTDARKAERLQGALFRIAQLSREALALPDFYAAVHGIVGELMDATNFFIAEYDEARDIVTFPYFVDERDKVADGLSPGHGLTAYVLRTGKPLFASPARFEELIAAGEVDLVGAPSVDWMGAPLTSGGRTWGVIGIQSYEDKIRFSERDLEILLFVAQNVASAIEQKRKADALSDSERRYRQMFENNRAVQLLIDPADGQIVDANMAACDFYGYTRDELRAMRMWNINVLGEAAIRQEMVNAAKQERSYFIFRHMLASGEVRDVEVHSGPIETAGRELLYSIIHDITERKRAEEMLLESEEKYRNIFDYASVGIYQATPDGTLLTANQTLASLLGYESVAELLTKHLADDIYTDPADRSALIATYEPSGVARNFELQWKRKDGARIWVQLSAHAIRSETGALYFEGFVYDITERKRAEQSLAAANAQRKAVLDSATRVAIIATDATGTITVFNTGAERMLGYAADEMIGQRSIVDLLRPEEVRQHGAGLTAEFDEREWTYLRNGGEPITVAASVTALRADDGSISGFLHVATDITARKQAEELLRKQSAAMTASMDGI